MKELHNNIDIKETQNSELNAFKKIEPKTNISLSDIGKIIESKFNALKETNDAKSEKIPKNHGEWTGEPGNSKWIPEDSHISQNLQTNPEQKPWKEMKEQHQITGIEFINNEPDFSEISRSTVKIENFTENRSKNFVQADALFAKAEGITPREAKQFRQENKLTWHERTELGVMDLVPREIHGAIPHRGGIAEFKSKHQMNGED